jgi:phospholipase/lecithinase/hemolysin
MSNGLVIAEHLAEHLNTKAEASMHVLDCNVAMSAGYNYAVLGAKIGLPGNDHFAGQVSCYLQRVGDADPDAVYFVLIGGNDVRMMDPNLTDAEAELILDPLVSTLMGQLDTLVNAGAKKVVVANMGNMGRLPSSNAAGNFAAGRLEAFSQIFNGILESEMGDFKDDNPTTTTGIHIFNLFGAMNDILDDAGSLGFVNSTDGCFDKEAEFVFPFDPYFFPCEELAVDTFVFIDPGGHATQKTNLLLWERLRDEVIIPAGW